MLGKPSGQPSARPANEDTVYYLQLSISDGKALPATMANVTDLQTKYSKLAQEYSKVKRHLRPFTLLIK